MSVLTPSQRLCYASRNGEVEGLQKLLSDPKARKEIDVDYEGYNWPPLGRAFLSKKQGSLACCLELLRYGASPFVNSGHASKVLSYFTDATLNVEILSLGEQEAGVIQKCDALFHAVLANRLVQNDMTTVCQLLHCKARLMHRFDPDALLAELPLHFQEPGQKSSLDILAAASCIRNREDIDDLIKERFLEFCKKKTGQSALLDQKPAQKPLSSALQAICSQLLASNYKPDLLEVLELEYKPGPTFIHEATEVFEKNFSAVFNKLFIKNPEAESILLENMVLYAELVQIFFYYVSKESAGGLESLLINAETIASKEPLAMGVLAEVAALRTENSVLRKEVEELKDQMFKLMKHLKISETAPV